MFIYIIHILDFLNPFVSQSCQSIVNSPAIKSHRYLENNDSAMQSYHAVNAVCNYIKFVCVLRCIDDDRRLHPVCIIHDHPPIRIITRAKIIPRNNFYRKNLYRSFARNRDLDVHLSLRRCYTMEMRRVREINIWCALHESPTNVSIA